MKSKQYKDLTINEKINVKSWGFWRLPNSGGFMLTMIDNAKSFEKEERINRADFLKHHLVACHQYEQPKRGNEIAVVKF